MNLDGSQRFNKAEREREREKERFGNVREKRETVLCE